MRLRMDCRPPRMAWVVPAGAMHELWGTSLQHARPALDVAAALISTSARGSESAKNRARNEARA